MKLLSSQINHHTICPYVAENRGEFLEKLQRARSQLKVNFVSQPVLSRPGTTRLVVGNWALSSRKESELCIHNSDGQQQATILREDLPGFIFESNRGTKHSFTAETSLGIRGVSHYISVILLMLKSLRSHDYFS